MIIGSYSLFGDYVSVVKVLVISVNSSHHLAIVKTSTPSDHLFIKYYLNFSFCFKFFNAFSTGKEQKEITNWAIRRIPIPLYIDKISLQRKFADIDASISKLEKYVFPLQKIIDDVLSAHNIKSKSEEDYYYDRLVLSISHVGKQKALRLGATYNAFWHEHKGLLFEGTNEDISTLPFKRAITIAPKVRIKKGLLNKPRVLIDFKQVEPLNGKIIDFNNIVVELGSDKIEFGDCHLLTNKLRPYLGYSVLNQSEYQLIGTTEFIPFNLRDVKEVSPKYIRYLLLSSEYLEKSKLLMSGKQHPRISEFDILNIKIPIPDPHIQQAIIKEISFLEDQMHNAINKINSLKNRIEQIIWEELESSAI